MNLADALNSAESQIQRPLLEDEILMVARLVEAGKDAADLVILVQTFDDRPPDLDEDSVPVNRYEFAGDQARRI